MSHLQPEHFDYEFADGVATVRLNRPERLNALTFASYQELTQAFATLQDIDEVRSVLLTGTGRAFCSGGDVEDIIGRLLPMDSEELLQFTRLMLMKSMLLSQMLFGLCTWSQISAQPLRKLKSSYLKPIRPILGMKNTTVAPSFFRPRYGGGRMQ